MPQGYLYALTNPSMPGVFKVGCTSNNPFERAKELHTTGVPTPFQVAAAVLVSDIRSGEKKLHALIEQKGERVDLSREFFRTDLSIILNCMAEISNGSLPQIESVSTKPSDLLRKAMSAHCGKETSPPDVKQAIKLYELVFATGLNDYALEACYVLFKLYEGGQGIRRSVEKEDYYRTRFFEFGGYVGDFSKAKDEIRTFYKENSGLITAVRRRNLGNPLIALLMSSSYRRRGKAE